MSHPFHIVDVFAEERYAGNQLAVVRDAGDLSDAEMQAIAAEMNYSETTFVESSNPTEAGYPVRIFTPKSELPFAGHPTLGTAYVLREESIDEEGTRDGIRLDQKIGSIPVTVERAGGEDIYWMKQMPPSFGSAIDPAFAARVVGLDPDDIDDRFPSRIVSTGVPTLIVPVASLDGVRRTGTDDLAYSELLETTDAENVLVFCPETVRSENDLHVRVFAPVHGVPEDPATGSSNGCLAAYLAREQYNGSPEIDVRVEQGYELDRPSLLLARASDSTNNSRRDEESGNKGEALENGGIDVRVGGRVTPVAEGTLL